MKRFEMWLKKRVVPWALPPLAFWIIRALGATLRIRVRDDHGSMGKFGPAPILFAFWHNRLFMMPYLYRKYCPDRKLTVMTSRSRDGDLIAAIIARFGIGAARGSSSRHGAKALLALIDAVRQGSDAGVTPDGPRGPRYEIQPGIVALAGKTGFAVLPITLHYQRKWVLPSWDRFQIPVPFARCELVLGPLLTVEDGDLALELKRHLDDEHTSDSE